MHPNRARIPALDALRGLLALGVVLVHWQGALGLSLPSKTGQAIVVIFFAMSGFVLARAYDGRPLTFLARRFIRLWPLFAVCMTVGAWLAHVPITLGDLTWWRLPAVGTVPAADPAAWSLYYEAWATPFMLASFTLARRFRIAAMAAAGASVLLILLDLRFVYAPFFAAGVAAAGFHIRFPTRMPAPLLWLGRISFSLYLTHPLVMPAATIIGAIPSLLLTFPVAWAAWWAIERPSIDLSRRVSIPTPTLRRPARLPASL